MIGDHQSLGRAWQARNAAAAALLIGEEQSRRAVREATIEQLVSLIETFSPARSTGPEWTRTFEPFVEHLWVWCDDATLAALANVFRVRGMPWLAVTNALSPEYGAAIRAALRQPAWARVPAFTIG